MKSTTLYIRESDIVSVGDMPQALKELGTTSMFRASHVVPVNPIVRAIFNWLRANLEERIGRWLSHQLPGPWEATILETGHTYTARSRARCVQWEVEELHRLMEKN